MNPVKRNEPGKLFIEVIQVANGWMVREGGDCRPFTEYSVFNDFDDLCGYIAELSGVKKK